MWNLPLVPEQASDQAAKVDAVMYMLLAVTAFFTVLIAGQVIYFGLKYRAGSKADRSGVKSASHRLEAFWIGGTFVLCVVMYVFSTHVYFQLYNPPPDPPMCTSSANSGCGTPSTPRAAASRTSCTSRWASPSSW